MAVTPLWSQLRHFDRSYATFIVVTPLWWPLRHFDGSYATYIPITPLWWQLRHFYDSYATYIAVTSLWWQLRHFDGSYATYIAVTPLWWHLRHFDGSYATFHAVTPLFTQLRHFSRSYATFHAVTPLSPDSISILWKRFSRQRCDRKNERTKKKHKKRTQFCHCWNCSRKTNELILFSLVHVLNFAPFSSVVRVLNVLKFHVLNFASPPPKAARSFSSIANVIFFFFNIDRFELSKYYISYWKQN